MLWKQIQNYKNKPLYTQKINIVLLQLSYKPVGFVLERELLIMQHDKRLTFSSGLKCPCTVDSLQRRPWHLYKKFNSTQTLPGIFTLRNKKLFRKRWIQLFQHDHFLSHPTTHSVSSPLHLLPPHLLCRHLSSGRCECEFVRSVSTKAWCSGPYWPVWQLHC